MNCPACQAGTMCEHDTGYDECNSCDFFAIYYDGRDPPVWTEDELAAIYAQELEHRREYDRQCGGTGLVDEPEF